METVASHIGLASRIMLSFILSVPLSVLVTWFVISQFKMKENAWPGTVVKSSVVVSILMFLLL